MKSNIPRKKDKFYYGNILASQNITARPNVAWVADITSLKVENLGEIQKTIHVFLCVDIHTNYIVATNFSTKILSSKAIVKSLSYAIDKRFPISPINKLIIHTDRGTQFSNKQYKISQLDFLLLKLSINNCSSKIT